MSYYYESEDDKMVWWLDSDVRKTVTYFKEQTPKSMRIFYDSALRRVYFVNVSYGRFWVCQFKQPPTPEEVEATINLVKAKYL